MNCPKCSRPMAEVFTAVGGSVGDLKEPEFPMIAAPCPLKTQEVMEAVAQAAAGGTASVKGYPVGNWTKGIPSSNLLKHALAHVYNYIDGDRSEDHLGHAIWNLMVAAHNEERRPDMHDLDQLAQVVTTDTVFPFPVPRPPSPD